MYCVCMCCTFHVYTFEHLGTVCTCLSLKWRCNWMSVISGWRRWLGSVSTAKDPLLLFTSMPSMDIYNNSMQACHGKNGPPKLFPPGTCGLPLDHLRIPQMKERGTWTYFTCKTWTSGISRRFLRFLETTQTRQFSSTQCNVVSFPAARNTYAVSAYIVQNLSQTHVSNAAWGSWCILMSKTRDKSPFLAERFWPCCPRVYV